MKRTLDIPAAAARVLIVDDEALNIELLEVMLGQQGFVLLTAASGEEALAITARERPDIILLDAMMPGMDGHEVVVKLKANPATDRIPIIMVSGLDGRKARLRGLSAGAEDFLSRPVDRAELQARVRNLLRLKAYGDYHRKHGQVLEAEVISRTAELVESEKRYRQIVESTTDGIVKVDAAASIVFANRRFADMLGYDVSELLGESAFSFMDSEPQTIAIEALTRRREGVTDTCDVNFRRKDGSALVVSLACTPILDEQGRYVGVLASARDMSEQRELLARLTLSDRMASIGTLAAGMAHEINNPLSCVMANLDLAAESLLNRTEKLGTTAEFTDVREELRDAREATWRIRNIVRDLRMFSRAEDDQTGPVNAERVLESTLRMARNEIRHRARIVKNYGRTPPVEASEARLGQVCLNLLINAAQAISEGHAADNEIRVSTFTHANGVVIEIADTGPGMPPEVLSRLFTPFFTTKSAAVGTGLGLSICHRIVVGCGGTIVATSEVGKGTAFRIWLPLASAEEPEEAPRLVAAVEAQRRGRILVIDDEPMIAKTVERGLFPEHEVVSVGCGQEALERISGGEQFDVILCDMMMPQMTGMELHAGLSRVAREQADKMIFLTGGAFTPRARAFLDTTANHHVEKPFDIGQLKALINDRVR